MTTASGAGGEAPWEDETDVIVLGGGIGGLSAAIAAAEAGARVQVLEVSSITGGCGVFSGGLIHTMGCETWEEYNDYTEGRHNAPLAQVYLATYWNDFIPFLQRHGARMHEAGPDKHKGWFMGYPGTGGISGRCEPGGRGPRRFFDSLGSALEALGGKVRLRHRAVQLHADASTGEVLGIRARVWSDSPAEDNQRIVDIRAAKTIVATGEWVGNPALRAQYLGKNSSWRIPLGGPYNVGDGHQMCLAAGAGQSRGMEQNYVGLLYSPSRTANINESPVAFEQMLEGTAWEDITARYLAGRPFPPMWVTPHFFSFYNRAPQRTTGIFVNQNGRRFVDEGSRIHAKYPKHFRAITEQPEGIAWLIGDQAIYDEDPGSEAALAALRAADASFHVADTLEALADALAREGMHRQNFMTTIRDYNRAIGQGHTDHLSPTRSDDFYPGFWKIETGPFYAVKIAPLDSTNFGGIMFNEHAQALDQLGRPVPNLYSPPSVGGGIYRDFYMGGLALAGTFGYLAGKHAAACVAGSGSG